MDRYFIITSPDGEMQSVRTNGETPDQAGYDCEAWTEVDRLLGEYEAFVDGAIALDAAAADAALHAQIDAAAGRERCRHITDVPGQQATYLDKEREARACLANPIGAYPRIAAEAAVRGTSAAATAAMIVATADQWRAIDTSIEAKRIGAKLAVSAATTMAAKRTAAQVDFDLAEEI